MGRAGRVGLGAPSVSWLLRLSSTADDNNVYEVMPSPVFLVSPISDMGPMNSATVSPIPTLSPKLTSNRRPLSPPWCLVHSLGAMYLSLSLSFCLSVCLSLSLSLYNVPGLFCFLLFETGSHCATQAGLEILPPQPPE
jgi:hypothetical protein